MTRIRYFREYVRGDKSRVGNCSLIFPGVALFVFGMFFINNGLVDRISIGCFLLLAPRHRPRVTASTPCGTGRDLTGWPARSLRRLAGAMPPAQH